MRRVKLAILPIVLASIGAAAPVGPVCAAEGCCKICKAGKACGDSCIARDKACKKEKGCACNG